MHLRGILNLQINKSFPAFVAIVTKIVFTFMRSDDSENDTTQRFQWSTNLQEYTDVALKAASSGVVTFAENETADDDVVIIFISKESNTKLLGRVKIEKSQVPLCYSLVPRQ
jgi:hypothetical protein